ncbi:MAG: hypothetical protein PHP45_08615 [Elusimicrobiales bacterium]|nr:hypothetical protein [Elusimicrobiales bacterium]
MSIPETGKIVIKADPEFAPLIPGYLENRLGDAAKVAALADAADFGSARRLGHCMKGSGSGYGFDGISEIGLAMEIAARTPDKAQLKMLAEKLKDYISRLEVTYE